MIKEILNPEFIDRKSRAVQAILELEARRIKAGDAVAAARAAAKGVTKNDLEEAIAALKVAESPVSERTQLTWIPRDPSLCLLQSTLTEAYLDANATDSTVSEGFAATGEFVPVTNVSLRPEYAAPMEAEAFDQYGAGDPLFVTGFAMARELQLLRGKHRFPDNPPTVRIQEKARVLLFGDWGSGLPRSKDLSSTIKARLAEAPDRDRHVIHLGDVYYAGFKKEYRRHVLTHWPVDPGQPISSWSLSGNHDMYTGGAGYFETMLGDPRFRAQRQASHFCLENEYWQILALDTSYEAPDWRGDKAGLYGDQAAWVARTRRAAPQKGGILLSHHQLFSPWEGHSNVLFEKLRQVLNEKLVKAWFWGHEHRCAIYKKMHEIEYPCLLGHAGVPVRFERIDDHSAVQWQWNDKIDYEGHSYATLGGAVLDFNDKVLDISFYNERGQKVATGRQERLELN
jgi:3',5'-cyclic AMP phosphodiesterase CpdA